MLWRQHTNSLACHNSHLFLELTPGGLVDASVPHLFIVIQLLGCLKSSPQTTRDDCTGTEDLRVIGLTHQLGNTTEMNRITHCSIIPTILTLRTLTPYLVQSVGTGHDQEGAFLI